MVKLWTVIYESLFAYALLHVSFRPFGAQLKPFLEMMTGPNGGQSVQELDMSQQRGGIDEHSKQ